MPQPLVLVPNPAPRAIRCPLAPHSNKSRLPYVSPQPRATSEHSAKCLLSTKRSKYLPRRHARPQLHNRCPLAPCRPQFSLPTSAPRYQSAAAQPAPATTRQKALSRNKRRSRNSQTVRLMLLVAATPVATLQSSRRSNPHKWQSACQRFAAPSLAHTSQRPYPLPLACILCKIFVCATKFLCENAAINNVAKK